MTRTQRTTLSGSAKAGLWLAGIFVVWQFLKWPPVFEAMMKFILAGIVPGTNSPMAPQTIIGCVAAALILIVVVLVAWPIIRNSRLKRHMARLSEADVAVDPALEPEVVLAEATVETAALAAALAPTDSMPDIITAQTDPGPVASGPSIRSRATRAIISALQFLGTHLAWTVPFVHRCVIKTRAAYKIIMAHLRPLLRDAGIIARIIYRELRIYARLFGRWSVKQSKAFWRWLEPRLRRFDAWLEIQYRILSKKMTRKMQQYDSLSAIAEVSQASKKAVGKLELTTKAKKAKAVTKTATKVAAHKAKPHVRKAHAIAKKTVKKARKQS